eukprot:CAMPEP_0172179358 /NCGR_PEP_ID=MMETSP1050-20130122/16574_1 /TAXON_ID=233186 /ORGANISM="Cryptomonas curvata, Strain CCAP979/52" /LENGTH=122 /DNA_ID=CAMNT_0012852233 /DNA_START=69 /DNA_END=433 /DNA_ORIENTATION=+
MYGPSSAPGMRTRKVSIFKFFTKKPKNEKKNLWVPGELEEDEEGQEQSTPAAADVLPQILNIIPRLKSTDPSEAAKAAAELVALTNRTSAEEDAIIGSTAVLQALEHVLCKHGGGGGGGGGG